MEKDIKHIHSQEHNKAIINRIARATGHMNSIKKMVEDGKDCSEILMQLSAVRSAINNIGRIILEEHINHCVVHAIENNDKEILENLNKAIEKFLK